MKPVVLAFLARCDWRCSCLDADTPLLARAYLCNTPCRLRRTTLQVTFNSNHDRTSNQHSLPSKSRPRATAWIALHVLSAAFHVLGFAGGCETRDRP